MPVVEESRPQSRLAVRRGELTREARGARVTFREVKGAACCYMGMLGSIFFSLMTPPMHSPTICAASSARIL